MPSDTILERIRSELTKYEVYGKREVPGRAVLVCPLGRGVLSALHVLFAPLDDRGCDTLSNIIPFSLPEDYLGLMRRWNGLRLFDEVLFIYGVVSDFNRSSRLEDIAPVALERDTIDAEARQLGAVSIGSIAAARTVYKLQLTSSGSAQLWVSDGKVKSFPSVTDMLLYLITVFSRLANERGLIDESAEAVEAEVEAILRGS